MGQQPPSNPGFRLGYVRSVYVESLGDDSSARTVQAQLVGAILNESHLKVETNRAEAHASLAGGATLSSGYSQWSIGTSRTSSAAAAVITPYGAAAAASAASSSMSESRGSTFRITDLGLTLTDMGGHLLWAFDPTRCRRYAVTSCAVEQLTRAIDKDAKAARSKH